MDFGANKAPNGVLNEGAFEERILEMLVLVLLESGKKSYGNNLNSWNILIRKFIAQVITMSVSVNMLLNAEIVKISGK